MTPTIRPTTTNGHQNGIKPSRRIVLSAMGPEGGGKTHMVLSMPRPILYFSIDPNTRAIVEKKFKVDDVSDLDPMDCQYVPVLTPLLTGATEQEVQEQATDAWFTVETMIRNLYDGMMSEPIPRSVVIDSGTILDRLNVARAFGRTDKISPEQRRNKLGLFNKEFLSLFDMLERANVHVGVTHRAKPRWGVLMEVRSKKGIEPIEGFLPGLFDRMGFKEMGNICNVETLHQFDPERSSKVSERFGMKVLRSRQRPAIVGDEQWGKDESGRHVGSFTSLAMRLYPGTTVEDWA